MKHVLRTMAFAAALLFSVTPAKAQEMYPYVGVGVGSYSFDVNVLGLPDSGSAIGGYLTLGADFGEYIGAELRIGTTGDADLFATTYSLDYFFSYLAKIQFPVSPELRIYGIIGGTSANVTTTAGLDETGNSLSYGIGLDYRVSERSLFGVEWVRYWDQVTVLGIADITVDGFAAVFKFEF